ncbi:hypothetical protein RUND412_002877 [Rhizina undulata]
MSESPLLTLRKYVSFIRRMEILSKSVEDLKTIIEVCDFDFMHEAYFNSWCDVVASVTDMAILMKEFEKLRAFITELKAEIENFLVPAPSASNPKLPDNQRVLGTTYLLCFCPEMDRFERDHKRWQVQCAVSAFYITEDMTLLQNQNR